MTKRHKEFRQIIEERLEQKPQEIISITDSLGRVLASDVLARYTSPPEDTAFIDGYAVRSSCITNVPTTLHKAGKSMASKRFNAPLYEGDAVKVYAGAPIPSGADTIIELSKVEERGEYVDINEPVMAGQNICYAGVDFSKDEIVLRHGSLINARDIGLAAAMKVPWIPVVRKPRIGVLAIGDELNMLGDHSGENRVTSSSSLVITAFIEACGGIPVNLGIASDSLSSIRHLLKGADGMDLLVTTGGVSASADGFLKKALSKLRKKQVQEIDVNLNQQEIVLFGERKGVPILSLPGNPISTQICAALFLRPAIEKMLNMREQFYKKSYAILDRDLDVNDLKMDYIFSRLSEGDDKHLLALPASSFDRLLLSSLAEADCLITVDKKNCKAGDEVEITRFTCSVVSG